MKTILEIEHPEGSRIILSSIGYAKDGRDYFGAAKAKIIEPSRPVEPSASGEEAHTPAILKTAADIDKFFDEKLSHDGIGTVHIESFSIDLAKENESLRKQNASLQSRLDVMQQDRDDWRDRAMHFAKLTGDAMKALDKMRPFQVKGMDQQ